MQDKHSPAEKPAKHPNPNPNPNPNQRFLSLAFSRRLAPLFWTQFCGAFNDNVYKSAFAVILVYKLLEGKSELSGILVNLTQALFILPFILFAAIAGSLGDVYDKTVLIRHIKLTEIFIVCLAAAALFLGNIPALMFVVFLLSVQSTFFGPLKYGIIPQHVPPSALVNSNALVSAGTFVAIIAGTLIGAYAATLEQYEVRISTLLLTYAIIGYVSSQFIPKAPPYPDANTPDLPPQANKPANRQTRLSYEPVGATIRLMRTIYGRQPQYRPYLWGVSWFWFVGSVLLTQIPILTEQQLKLEDISVSFFMVMFATGIACGSLITGIVLKNKPTSKYAGIAALFMAILSLDLILAMRQFNPDALLSLSADDYVTLVAFLTNFHGIRLSLDFFLISLFGGFYVIPLFTVLISLAKPEERSRVIAANNIFNALFMVGSALAVMVIYAVGGGLTEIFPLITVSALLVSFLWFRKSRSVVA